MSPSTLAFGLPGHWEWVVIGMIALLLFGSRLPQVMRSIGDGVRELKKGLKDVGDDVKSAGDEPDPNPYRDEQRQFSSAKPPVSASGEDERVPRRAPSESS